MIGANSLNSYSYFTNTISTASYQDVDPYWTDQYLYGTVDGDWLFGHAGDDWIYGYQGDDYLFGGYGNDHLYGGWGADHLDGEEGNDHLYGGLGDDWLEGGADSDTLRGEGGDDVANGGAGDDYVYGGAGDDRLSGGEWNDQLYGDGGIDYLFGGSGSLDIDHLYGGDENDVLEGGGSADILNGGAGADTFVFRGEDSLPVFGASDRIDDFDANVDRLALYYDANAFGQIAYDAESLVGTTYGEIATTADTIEEAYAEALAWHQTVEPLETMFLYNEWLDIGFVVTNLGNEHPPMGVMLQGCGQETDFSPFNLTFYPSDY